MTHIPSAAALAALLASTLVPAQAAVTLTHIAPGSWGASDAALGLSGAVVIEDFEDVTLIPGLQVTSSGSSNGSYGPTGTLPRTFDPRPTAVGGDDPYGNAFWSYNCGTGACSSLWDGSHALINTGTNGVAPYGGSTWADITLDIAGGATQVGFSLQQNEYPISVSINGTAFGSLPAGGGVRTGYFRFDVSGDAPITQIRLDGHTGDAWVIDHLAITAAVPEPGALALALAGLAVVGSAVRRQRAR